MMENMGSHIPVLAEACLQAVEELSISPQRYLDLTLGRGGHAELVLKKFKNLKMVGIDCDTQALENTTEKFKALNLMSRSQFHHCNFHNWVEFSDENQIPNDFDFVMIDLGVSSPQLDQAERGFSFYKDGPLDMRMDQTQGFNAAEIINEWNEHDLNETFRTYGEIRNPFKVTRKILEVRKKQKIITTIQLAELIESIVGWRKKGFHPASTYFLALRIVVNNEIKGLKDNLPRILSCVKARGRILVLTFHSLEDRLVKNIFKNSDIGFPVNKKVIKPSREEISKNARSRSAYLRVFQRGQKPQKERKFKYARKE